MTMKHNVHTIACGTALILAAAMAAGCGGRQSMASKSAAAYDEARRKGVAVTAGEHGGHEAEPAAEPAHGAMPGMDHSQMPGMDHGAMSGMDHSSMKGMDHSQMAGMNHSSMKGMDHSQMSGMDHSSMAGMDHSSMKGMDHSSMTGMDHSSMAGMQHGSMAGNQHTAAPPVEIAPPASNAAIAQTKPAATLQQDEFDAPAPSAVGDAAKASGAPKPPGDQHHHGDGEEE